MEFLKKFLLYRFTKKQNLFKTQAPRNMTINECNAKNWCSQSNQINAWGLEIFSECFFIYDFI